MIADHHKITPSHANHDSLVEPFRRTDWIDVTRGLRTFELPRPLIRSVLAGWPSAGFHWRLVQLTLERFRTHPLTPFADGQTVIATAGSRRLPNRTALSSPRILPGRASTEVHGGRCEMNCRQKSRV